MFRGDHRGVAARVFLARLEKNLLDRTMPEGQRARPEQAILFKAAPRIRILLPHIPPAIEAADVAAALAARDARIAAPKAEVARPPPSLAPKNHIDSKCGRTRPILACEVAFVCADHDFYSSISAHDLVEDGSRPSGQFWESRH
jgi:hypothetical protein